jgi:ABC-2 type transport system ATP-binding protein
MLWIPDRIIPLSIPCDSYSIIPCIYSMHILCNRTPDVSEAMISIQNLTRSYGSIKAVNDFSVNIGRGEVVGLLGHNGAGKTTVMKILTGCLEPSSGSLSVGGIDVTADRAGVQRQIGYLPEEAPLYPEMLVQEYLQMMAELRDIAEGELRGAIAEAVRATGLEKHLIQRIGTLSKGYRQRVGLAQAIIHKPDVLVLDEPTNGLDPVQIQSIRELILRLSEQSTIILSTHILQEIEAVCRRVLVMIDGCLVADSGLEELLSSDIIALSLERGADDVEHRLGEVEGIRSVTARGDDRMTPGFVDWAVECASGASPTPAIIEACLAAGWTIGSVAPEHRTLESVFQDLQQRHITEQEAQPQ